MVRVGYHAEANPTPCVVVATPLARLVVMSVFALPTFLTWQFATNVVMRLRFQFKLILPCDNCDKWGNTTYLSKVDTL